VIACGLYSFDHTLLSGVIFGGVSKNVISLENVSVASANCSPARTVRLSGWCDFAHAE